MKTNYDQIMDWVFVSEGGYAERDSEPGGAVNMGISFTAFKDWWAKTKKEGAPSWSDLKGLSRGEAEEIYRHYFFSPIRFDQLPSGVDYAFIDFAVNSGVGGCIRSVQRNLGFPVTGRIDTNNKDAPFFWAIRTRPPKEIIDAVLEARLALMMGSSKWERFEGNWTRRLKLVKDRCYKMAGIEGEDNGQKS